MARIAIGLLVVAVILSPGVRAQTPDVSDLDVRVVTYVERFFDGLVNVVAEETSQQRSPSSRRQRRLRSQLLLVRPGGTGPSVVYRDVLEVDGRRVTNHDQRLEELFATSSPDRQRQAEALTADGARFNLIGIGSLNNPLIAIGMLQERYLQRFSVTEPRRARDRGADVWELRYTEQARPTLLRTPSGRDLPAKVIAAVQWPTGRVIRTELQAGNAQVVTLFGRDERLDTDVPVEMRDSYAPDNIAPTFGEAHYSRFRRFTVNTTESLDTPPSAR